MVVLGVRVTAARSDARARALKGQRVGGGCVARSRAVARGNGNGGALTSRLRRDEEGGGSKKREGREEENRQMIVSEESRHGSATAERDARGDGLTGEEDDDDAAALHTLVPVSLAQVHRSIAEGPVVSCSSTNGRFPGIRSPQPAGIEDPHPTPTQPTPHHPDTSHY